MQFLIAKSNFIPQHSSEDSTTQPVADTMPSLTFGWVPRKSKKSKSLKISKLGFDRFLSQNLNFAGFFSQVKLPKMSDLNFWILAFSTNFCSVKIQLFKNLPFLAFLLNFWFILTSFYLSLIWISRAFFSSKQIRLRDYPYYFCVEF